MLRIRLILGIPVIILMYILAFYIPLETWNIIFTVVISLLFITLVIGIILRIVKKVKNSNK